MNLKNTARATIAILKKAWKSLKPLIEWFAIMIAIAMLISLLKK